MANITVPAGTEVMLNYTAHKPLRTYVVYHWDRRECPNAQVSSPQFTDKKKLEHDTEFTCHGAKEFRGETYWYLYFATVGRNKLDLPT